MVLALLILLSLLAIVATRQASRELFIALQTAQNQHFKLDIEWGQLQLEQSTLAAHGRIDALAQERLSMAAPAVNEVIVIRRPTAPR